jgi:hypothetical protein
MLFATPTLQRSTLARKYHIVTTPTVKDMATPRNGQSQSVNCILPESVAVKATVEKRV